MLTLTEDTISIQSTDNEKEEIIEDDENEDEEEDNENNENEDENNKNEDENKNKEEDNENNNDNDNNNNKRETNNQRLKTSDVWNFVDKETHKCLSCSKIFEKKTGTSSIHIYLKSHGILLIKEK